MVLDQMGDQGIQSLSVFRDRAVAKKVAGFFRLSGIRPWIVSGTIYLCAWSSVALIDYPEGPCFGAAQLFSY